MAFMGTPQYGLQPNPYGFGQPGVGFGNPSSGRRSLYAPREFTGYAQEPLSIGSKIGQRGANAFGNMVGKISGGYISEGLTPMQRPQNNAAQPVGATAGSTVGSDTGSGIGSSLGTAGGAVAGQALIPVPFVGAAIGGALGGFIGDVTGDLVGSYFDEEPEPVYARAQPSMPPPMPMTRIQRNQFQPTYSQRYGVSGLRGFG